MRDRWAVILAGGDGTRLQSIEDSNFSHQVLAVRPEDLMVMRVGDVGWSDLAMSAS
ncbi:MAG TPA: hypothetical protein VF290_04715 [Pyrinomonadaceae bacterium]